MRPEQLVEFLAKLVWLVHIPSPSTKRNGVALNRRDASAPVSGDSVAAATPPPPQRALRRAQPAQVDESSHLSSERSMPALATMGIDRADIRFEGPLVVIASSWTKHRRRWFVSDGYHVAFYKTRELTVRRGRFDLRTVLRIEPSRLAGRDDLGEGAPPGAELLLDELGTRVAVAFVDAADARQWLGLWCSACTAAVVDPRLLTHRLDALSARLRAWYSAQAVEGGLTLTLSPSLTLSLTLTSDL